MPPVDRAIAPHLREPIFRAYEDLLATAVTNWPKETSYDIPKGVASATFLANFRNSIVSLITYNWPTTIPVDKLKALREERAYVITYRDDGKLWFCAPRARAVKPVVTTSTAERAHSPVTETKHKKTDHPSEPLSTSLVPWRDWTEAEITAACILLDKQRITGPIFLIGPVEETISTQLMSLYNVALVFDEQSKQTILT